MGRGLTTMVEEGEEARVRTFGSCLISSLALSVSSRTLESFRTLDAYRREREQ